MREPVSQTGSEANFKRTKNMLKHRPAGESDLSAICSLVRSAEELYYFHPRARFPLTPEQIRIALSQSLDATVVLMNGQIAGFANFTQASPGDGCTIGNVVVAPESRGRGVGRYLLEAMIRFAHERHQASQVEVGCFSDNIAGLLLYTKLGFAPVDIEVRYGPDGRRRALIHMALNRPEDRATPSSSSR
jgi:ribosomal protein S18 acetylase RimI-like enzyme